MYLDQAWKVQFWSRWVYSWTGSRCCFPFLAITLLSSPFAKTPVESVSRCVWFCDKPGAFSVCSCVAKALCQAWYIHYCWISALESVIRTHSANLISPTVSFYFTPRTPTVQKHTWKTMHGGASLDQWKTQNSLFAENRSLMVDDY